MDLEAARAMLQEGRPRAALRILDVLLERNPGWVDALRETARAVSHVEAEALLAKALELEPGAPDIRVNLASVLEGQGRSAEAVAILTRLNEEDPAYVMAAVALVQRDHGALTRVQGGGCGGR